jgi:hypothetical protein
MSAPDPANSLAIAVAVVRQWQVDADCFARPWAVVGSLGAKAALVASVPSDCGCSVCRNGPAVAWAVLQVLDVAPVDDVRGVQRGFSGDGGADHGQ